MKILLRLQYLGTDFCGWQFQPGVRTVQNTLTEAAEALFGKKCNITGCSRTDSGVHANDFAATVELPEGANRIPPSRIPTAFAPFLPSDLSVTSAREVPDDFHPRYDVVAKEYHYKVCLSPVADPFLYGRVWHYTGRVLPDAVERMNACAEKLVGTKEFTSFMAAGSKIEDTERTVYHCRVTKEGNILTVSVAANGFLYNMVRIIVGTLMQAACGKLTPEEMEQILLAKDRKRAGLTAPPEGLYLHRVTYPDEQ